MKNNEKQEWYLNGQLINCLLIFIIVGVLVLPIVIFCRGIGNKGSIGDAFNGLLAPFISLLAALLVYKSFKAQIEANKLQLRNNEMVGSQWRFELHLRILDDIRDDLNKLKIKTARHDGEYGINALKIIANEDWPTMTESDLGTAFNDLQGILREFLFLISIAEKEEHENKTNSLQKIELFYSVKLAAYLPLIRTQIVKNEKTESLPQIIKLIADIQSRMFTITTRLHSPM